MTPTNRERAEFRLGLAIGLIAGVVTVAIIGGLFVWLGVSPL